MVTEMTKYDFILMSGDADAFLEKLQSVGVVDITRSLKPIDDKSEKLSARAEIYRKALAALKMWMSWYLGASSMPRASTASREPD